MDYMLAQMWGWQLQEWYWFFELEPFGSEIDEMRFGQISATQANSHRDSKSRPFRATDFYVGMTPPKQKQSPKDMLNTMTGLFGGS